MLAAPNACAPARAAGIVCAPPGAAPPAARAACAAPARSRAPRLACRAQDNGSSPPEHDGAGDKKVAAAQVLQRAADALGVSLGPIGLTLGQELSEGGADAGASTSGAGGASTSGPDGASPPRLRSIASMTTAEWRAAHEGPDGAVDLWLEDEFNAGSRLVGGRAAAPGSGSWAGRRSGEGRGDADAARHTVTIVDREGVPFTLEVPEDRYILWEAEDQGLTLPQACRMGCCTACCVRVAPGGAVEQRQGLGLSLGLREQGYALMCVAFPRSDLTLELVPEDEAYELQFGAAFREQAVDKNSPSVARDDFALELAMLDE